jgi:hypothetical protein
MIPLTRIHTSNSLLSIGFCLDDDTLMTFEGHIIVVQWDPDLMSREMTAELRRSIDASGKLKRDKWAVRWLRWRSKMQGHGL